jgi:hypothetical protein
MPGARCTRGLVRNDGKKSAHEHTGSAEALRHSLRDGCAAYGALSPVSGSLATVAPHETHRGKLDPSIGRSGPHAFAVRTGLARLAKPARPSHPASTFVTTRTPLCARRDAQRGTTDLPDEARGNFRADGVERRSGLRSLAKTVFAREPHTRRHHPRKRVIQYSRDVDA